MKETNNHNRLVAVIWGIALAAAGCLTLWYSLQGHGLIRTIYEGKSFGFLNAMITGQRDFPLQVYYRTADATVIALSVMAGIAGILSSLLSSGGWMARHGWKAAGILTFFMVSAANFLPAFGENELVYLIFPKRLADPEFLAFDWTWKGGQYEHFIFDALVSPFTLFLNDLCLALAGRCAVWMLLIGAFIKLAESFDLDWRQFVLGFGFWFYANQSLAAGEWVFGGFESKGVAYVFVLLALHSVLKDRFIRAALFSGIAVSFHVVVGSWAAIGLFAAVLSAENGRDFKHLFLFLILTFVLGLPGLIPAVLNIWRNGPTDNEHYLISVLFRGPHHKDPFYFLTPVMAAEMAIGYGLTVFLMKRSFEKHLSRKLIVFLTALMAVFGLGVLARKLNIFSFLCLFPFRLGPVFLLLFFAFSAMRLLGSCSGKGGNGLRGLVFCVLAAGLIYHQMPLKLLKQARGAVYVWGQYLAGNQRDDFAAAAKWIDNNLPNDSICAAPPWENRFWLLAKRAQVSSFKYLPSSGANKEWMQRQVSLNGGTPFEGRGNDALDELKKNYPDLTAKQLLEIARKYSAGYYLTTKDRDDLPFRLLYSNRSYYLYQLECY